VLGCAYAHEGTRGKGLTRRWEGRGGGPGASYLCAELSGESGGSFFSLPGGREKFKALLGGTNKRIKYCLARLMKFRGDARLSRCSGV
jgi:hypothetical protein